MTELLEQAFEEAAQLPESEQDTLAQWLLEELRSEQRWTETFSRSQSELASLAEEALQEHRRGETTDLDPDSI